MPLEDVGKLILYHTADGDQPGVIVDYQAGRDAGDHLIAGWNNVARADATGAGTFRLWSVFREGTEEGTFRFR